MRRSRQYEKLLVTLTGTSDLVSGSRLRQWAVALRYGLLSRFGEADIGSCMQGLEAVPSRTVNSWHLESFVASITDIPESFETTYGGKHWIYLS